MGDIKMQNNLSAWKEEIALETGVHGGDNIKMDLKKQYMEMLIGFIYLRIVISGGLLHRVGFYKRIVSLVQSW